MDSKKCINNFFFEMILLDNFINKLKNTRGKKLLYEKKL